MVPEVEDFKENRDINSDRTIVKYFLTFQIPLLTSNSDYVILRTSSGATPFILCYPLDRRR
jgi:hypothetical protein